MVDHTEGIFLRDQVGLLKEEAILKESSLTTETSKKGAWREDLVLVVSGEKPL